MRLTSAQREHIKTAVAKVVGPGSRVWLFGSRVDDTQRGGDIDLFIETDDTLPNRARTLCLLDAALVQALGDRKIDILLKDAHTPHAPIHAQARTKGVML